MRERILRSAVCCLALACAGGAALAQTGPCEGLQGATPGLYGLCLAFHNVEPCVPNRLAADPFADCEAKDGRLLEAYNNLKGPDDPLMPGTEGPCPCFTQAEMEDGAALWSDFDVCAIDSPYLFHPSQNWPGEMLITSIWHNDELTGYTDWGGQADLTTSNSDNGPGRPGTCSYMALGAELESLNNLTYAEATACRDIIVDLIQSRADDCKLLCDPDCPE